MHESEHQSHTVNINHIIATDIASLLIHSSYSATAGTSASIGKHVEVKGARKVWGTVQAASTSTVANTIKRLTPIAKDDHFTVKKKTRSGTKDMVVYSGFVL